MFDIAKSHNAVVAVLASHAIVADGMAQLIDFCADQESWRGWSALRKLDFAADEKRLKRWLQGVLTNDPPHRNIKALWFGLFNPVVDGRATCGMYMAGSKKFDAADETFEWVCGPDYFPNGQYANLQVLDEIYRQFDEPASRLFIKCFARDGNLAGRFAMRMGVYNSDDWETMALSPPYELCLKTAIVDCKNSDRATQEPISEGATSDKGRNVYSTTSANHRMRGSGGGQRISMSTSTPASPRYGAFAAA